MGRGEGPIFAVGPIGFVTGPMEHLAGKRPSPNLGDTLGVFRRARLATEEMPAELQQRVKSFVQVARFRQPDLGEPLTTDSRIAMREVGPSNDPLFLVPTDTGAVCYVAGTIVGCMSRLIQGKVGWNITYWPLGDVGRTDLMVHGVIGDGIEKMSIVFRPGDNPPEVEIPARLSENAFVADLKKTDIDPLDILRFHVRLADGRAQVVPADPS
jgi:hypothetical protein